MPHVLIVFFATASGYTSVTMQEFTTAMNCEVAKSVVLDKLDKKGNSDAICVRQ